MNNLWMPTNRKEALIWIDNFFKTKFKNLILKLGERGIFSVSRYPKNKDFSFAVPSFTNKVQDAVGAGDAMLSYAI